MKDSSQQNSMNTHELDYYTRLTQDQRELYEHEAVAENCSLIEKALNEEKFTILREWEVKQIANDDQWQLYKSKSRKETEALIYEVEKSTEIENSDEKVNVASSG